MARQLNKVNGMWALKFRNLEGMEGEFNTIRVGRAWGERLQPGDRIALINARTGEQIGTAKVIRTNSGSKSLIESLNWKNNHSMLPQGNGSPEAMSALLRKRYGKMIYDNSKYATAIYLKRD